MTRRAWQTVLLVLVAGGAIGIVRAGRTADKAVVVEVENIWDKAPHNAFTDLARYRDRWYCVFREGSAHVSPDGAIRVLTSADGVQWLSAALLSEAGTDLRDPKLVVTPDNRLMLTAVAAYPKPAEVNHQSMAWLSSDGRNWTKPVKIGDPNIWLWRVTWNRSGAYSMGYSTSSERYVRMYFSPNSLQFQVLGNRAYDQDYPNETSILFQADDSALCLLRRDGGSKTALLGYSRPPYRGWTWEDLGVRIGGPDLIRLPDGRIVAAGRLYDGKTRTSLCWLNREPPSLEEFLALPSGGDTSYPGLVYYDGLLWVSYYSSHEGKASIYLAKVKLPETS